MLCAIGVHAQKLKINTVPEGLQKAYLDGKDTVPVVNLKEIYIYPPVKFKNKREQARYTKLVRDVKRTLPYAKMVYETLIETYRDTPRRKIPSSSLETDGKRTFSGI